MKNLIIVISLLCAILMANSASSAEPSDNLNHAIYVAFQAPIFFTNLEISSAQNQVIDSANNGNKLAERVAPKLAAKITEQALAQR